jgi:general stress protein YciG
MSEVENAIREHMRALGRKGGAATKQWYDSAHYRSIGKLGGIKSGAARRTRPETYPTILTIQRAVTA